MAAAAATSMTDMLPHAAVASMTDMLPQASRCEFELVGSSSGAVGLLSDALELHAPGG